MAKSDIKKPANDAADLTTAIKQLSVPVDTVGDAFEDPGGTALLLCKDNDSKKWGPRWLSQCDLQVSVPSDPANALQIVRSNQPDVVVVDASLETTDKRRIFEVLQEAADVQSRIIVLCAGNADIKIALESGVYDMARKPYNWQLIAKRARRAVRIKLRAQAFDEANEGLKEALEIANTARERLRSQERFEPVTGTNSL